MLSSQRQTAVTPMSSNDCGHFWISSLATSTVSGQSSSLYLFNRPKSLLQFCCWSSNSFLLPSPPDFSLLETSPFHFSWLSNSQSLSEWDQPSLHPTVLNQVARQLLHIFDQFQPGSRQTTALKQLSWKLLTRFFCAGIKTPFESCLTSLQPSYCWWCSSY